MTTIGGFFARFPMRWPESIRRLPKLELYSLITGTFGFVTDVVTLTRYGASFWGLSFLPSGLAAVGLGAVILLILWAISLVLFFRARSSTLVDHRNRPMVTRPTRRARRLGLCGMIGLPVAALLVLLGWGVYQYQPQEDVIILITDIEGPQPDRYRVTENLLLTLRSELATIGSVRVDYLSRAVSEAEGAGVARALARRPIGSRNDATIVIWGWYAPTATHAQVMLHVELLIQPSPSALVRIDSGSPRTYSIAELDGFTLQPELSSEMAYLGAFIAGVAYHGRGERWAALQSYDLALSLLQARSDPGGEAVVRFFRGNVCQEQGDYQAAIADYGAAILCEPNLSVAYFGRGTAHYYLGDYEEALADLTEAIRLDPYDSDAYANRGAAQDALGAYDEAIADYGKAILLNPRDAQAYTNRGVAYFALGQYEEAIADSTEAIRLDPFMTDAYANRGAVHGAMGQFEDAFADLNEALRLDPTHAGAYMNRGLTHFEASDYTEALADLDQAIDLDANFANAYYNRALVYKELGQHDEALADYTHAIHLAPHLVAAYYNRGMLYATMNDREQAIADYTEAIRLDPDCAMAYNNRGALHRELGDHDEAMADFSEAIRLDPNLAEAYYNRGAAYFELGEYDKAIADLECYLQLAPPGQETWATRAQEYIDEARRRR